MAKLALLIGVSEYEPGLNPLPAAVRDVEALQKVLLNPAIGGFAESDVVLLKNPNRQTMEEAIETLFTGRSKDDLVLLFFSGHGLKDDANRLFLTTRGTRKTLQGDLIRSTAVQSSFIQDSMSRSRSKRQVVILDSCFSGAFAEGLLARDDGTVDIRSQLGGEGRAILTSSSSTQYSFEYEGSELSLYTRFLIEGIETGAADADEDEVVSIDELHEYASRKVKEIKPELKPEIFAIREGFKIRLTKIPAIDPQQKYRREVARFMNYRGEISSINRRTLNIIKNRLQLDETEAQAIEHEILEPTRLQFTKNLQEYELAFSDVIQKNENLSDLEREDLGQLQRFLELSDGDTRAIESKVKAQLQAYRQHLQEYEQVFWQALRLEYPLGDSKRVELQQVQQKLALKKADIESIETKVTAKIKDYYRHLEQYKQLFIKAANQDYPLSNTKRRELLQHQENLGLSDLDVSTIEAKITTKIETYQQKLKQYQQAFLSATQAKYLPTSPIRKQLQQTWQTLGLTEASVIAIESPIIAQINLYQQNLEQYEKEFDSAVQQQYPLGEAKRNELTQLKLTLNLSDDDVTAIESPIKAAIAEHLQKLQQYKEAFLEAIQDEFPLTEETRQDLKRFQQVLEISNKDCLKIEKQVIARRQGSVVNPITKNPPPSVSPQYRIEKPSELPSKTLFTPSSQPKKVSQKIKIVKECLSFLSLFLGIFGLLFSSLCIFMLSSSPTSGFPLLALLASSSIGISFTWSGWTLLKSAKKIGFSFILVGGVWGLLCLVYYYFLANFQLYQWQYLILASFGFSFVGFGLILLKNIKIQNPYKTFMKVTPTLRKKILIGLSVLIFILLMTFVVWPNLPSELQKTRESRAKAVIGALNRAQQVYFSEKNTFASDINMLEFVIPDSRRYYVFSIPTPGVALALTNNDSQKGLKVPTSKKTLQNSAKVDPDRYFDSNIKSYIGGVSVNPTTKVKVFRTVICRQTGSEPLTIKNITGYGVVKEGGVACGPNTEEVESCSMGKCKVFPNQKY